MFSLQVGGLELFLEAILVRVAHFCNLLLFSTMFRCISVSSLVVFWSSWEKYWSLLLIVGIILVHRVEEGRSDQKERRRKREESSVQCIRLGLGIEYRRIKGVE